MTDSVESIDNQIDVLYQLLDAAEQRKFKLKPNYAPLEYLVSSKYNQYLLNYKVLSDNNLHDDNLTNSFRQTFYFSDFKLVVNYSVGFTKEDISAEDNILTLTISINFIINNKTITIEYEIKPRFYHTEQVYTNYNIKIIREKFQSIWTCNHADLEVLLNNRGAEFFNDLSEGFSSKINNFQTIFDFIKSNSTKKLNSTFIR